MAGASMNDIKARIKSVRGTMQITKAMELVATSKLRRAKEKVEKSRPFFETLREAIGLIESSAEAKNSPWSCEREISRTLYVVIAGDRGLAGGYNANIFRLAASLAVGGEAVYLPIGKKALEYYKHRNMPIYSSSFGYVSEIGVGDSLAMAEILCRGYLNGEFDSVKIVYTHFSSMISQTPMSETLLPLSIDCEGGKTAEKDPVWEGEPEEILASIVPEYLGGVIYSAICEALASESGARRMAMNSANKNAEEMIDALMLGYNRARQAVITQEITEIVSGAEAL